MKKLCSALPFALTGIGIGIPCTLVCMILIGGYHPVIREFLIWTVASALFGLLSGLLFHNNEALTLPVATILHCIGCMSIAIFAAWLCGYAPSIVSLFLAISPVFLVIYIMIYGICMLAGKLQAKKINKSLEEK